MPVSRFEFPLSFSYDLAARLSTQATEAGTFAWSCTPWNGLPAAVTNLDCGLSVAYEYDVLDRITSIHWRKANGATLRSFGYAFDRAGNITNLLMASEALPSRTTDYGYDMLDRLTAETSPGRANAWSYDLAGNRTNAVLNGTSTACTLGVGDRLAATSDGASYLYNAAGCVTNISSASYVVSLSWNSRYQLDAAYTNGVLAETYQYDALGRRVATTSGGTTTCHVYDGGWQVLADLDADGQPLRSYTWGPGIDHLLAMTTYGSTTNTYYAITDHLGTVHALVDFSGAIAESYEFDARGNVLAIHDASGSPIGNRQSTIGNRYIWQGRECSFATGLCHFRLRWYDPATGRWLSNDPIGISGGLNQYVFCGNNPVNRTDPFGLRDVVIQLYYNLTAAELPAAAQKEVERIYLDAFNKYGKTKEHTLKFEWKESKECPGDTGYSGGNLFGFNPTQARFFLDQSNKMKVIGYNPCRWTAYINATGIREQATDYNVGMGVTIAHETGLHGLANKTDLSGANANGFVDTSMGAPSSGAPVFSPNIGKAIMDGTWIRGRT